MRRLATLAAAVVLASGAAVAASAAPAHADPDDYPDGTLRGVTYYRTDCVSHGNDGLRNGRWDMYICDHYQGFWFLWTFDYAS